MVSHQATDAADHLGSAGRELYRERCRDEDGNRYTVIVWRSYPGLSSTFYTLDDGTPVLFEDDCVFTVVPTGEQLTRCDD